MKNILLSFLFLPSLALSQFEPSTIFLIKDHNIAYIDEAIYKCSLPTSRFRASDFKNLKNECAKNLTFEQVLQETGMTHILAVTQINESYANAKLRLIKISQPLKPEKMSVKLYNWGNKVINF